MHQTPSRYIPAIDGLRAIAVLSVIFFHAGFADLLPGGFTGVDMFFVISGYVISRSLAEHGSQGFFDYLKDFYRRRLLRILSALLLVLSVSFILSAMFMPQFWLSGLFNRTGLAAFLGLSNIVLAGNTDTYFSPGAELNPYLHTWSLGVEEQFYVLFPAMFFVWLRYRERTAVAWMLLPGLALASLGLSAFQTLAQPLQAFYLLPGRFWELAAGALLFQIMGTTAFSARAGKFSAFLLPGGLALVLTGFLFAGRDLFPFPWALATVVGTVLAMAGLVLRNDETPASLAQRLLQSSLATYVGRLSYSLYLWHWPVLVLLRWTTGVDLLAVRLLYPIIVLTLAAASYHWIEMPIRAGRSLLQRRAWITAAAGLGAVGVLWGGAFWITNDPALLSLSRTRDSYVWHAYKHYPREEIHKISDPLVEGRRLFVIGDSHAAAYRTMLKEVSLTLDIDVMEYERGGCGVVTLLGSDPADCNVSREAALKDVEAHAKPGDIVFLASLRMPELDGLEWQRGEDVVLNEVLSHLTPQKNNDARISAEKILSRLKELQVQVLVDAPKPVFKAPPNRCSDWFNYMNPVCAPGLTMTRAQLERLRAPQMKLLGALQHKYPALHVWDPFPLLCPGATCSTFDDNGKPLFFDSNHLSGNGNRLLTPSFLATILAIWRGPDARRDKAVPQV